MISIGYDPTTGEEHLVWNTEPHPGDHLLSSECWCKPSRVDQHWNHRLRVMGQSVCRAPHCWSEYGTPCGDCSMEETEMSDLTFNGLRKRVSTKPDRLSGKDIHDVEVVKALALIQIAQELNEIKVMLSEKEKRERMLPAFQQRKVL